MLKHGYTLTMMAAVSVVSAIEKVTGAGAFIKWPNDIMLGNKKIGGILTEVKSRDNIINFSSLGIGLNVNTDLASMPDDVKEKASSLKIETGCHIERNQLLLEILSEIEHWYHILKLKSDGKDSVFYTWRNMCKTPGTMVSVLTGNTLVRGHALGVGSSGELLVQSETGEIQKITAGDVTPCRR